MSEAMGMPTRRTGSEAFRVVANNPGVEPADLALKGLGNNVHAANRLEDR